MQNTMLGWNGRWPVHTILSALSTMKRSATLCVVQVDSHFPYPGFLNQNIFYGRIQGSRCLCHSLFQVYLFFFFWFSVPPPSTCSTTHTFATSWIALCPLPSPRCPITLSLPTSISTPNACSVLDGDCRVHCSTSGNGGQ